MRPTVLRTVVFDNYIRAMHKEAHFLRTVIDKGCKQCGNLSEDTKGPHTLRPTF